MEFNAENIMRRAVEDVANLYVYPVCMQYKREIVILSDGTVVPCCMDTSGVNTLGNCFENPLIDLWRKQNGEIHNANVIASRARKKWNSALCNSCLDTYKPHFGVSQYTTQREIDSFESMPCDTPYSIVIEPVAGCNYRCYQCPARTVKRQKAVMSLATFKEHIAPHISQVKLIRFYNDGEPFLHPELMDFLPELRKAAPKAVIHISTNAMIMTRDLCEKLVECKINSLMVSLHGGHTQEHLALFASGDLDAILPGKDAIASMGKLAPNIKTIENNLKMLTEVKKKHASLLPWINLKVLLGTWNDSPDEMDDYLRWAKTIGADFAGWGWLSAEDRFVSKRVRPGTRANRVLRKRKLHISDFMAIFPNWPEPDFIPPPMGGLPLEKEDEDDWRSDSTEILYPEVPSVLEEKSKEIESLKYCLTQALRKKWLRAGLSLGAIDYDKCSPENKGSGRTLQEVHDEYFGKVQYLKNSPWVKIGSFLGLSKKFGWS